jgi:hypothetical protein
VTSLGGRAGESPDVLRARRSPTWPRVAVVAAVLVLAFVVSRSCGDSQVTQEEALAIATELVDFTPEDPQIRFLRQGINRQPFWVISLSTLSPDGERYAKLAVIRIDATTGEVVEFREQKDAKRNADEAP